MFGQKAYCSFSPRTRFLFLLHDARSGDLLALIEADRMGQIRTGAASGVATDCLAAKRNSMRVGVYGAGWQAHVEDLTTYLAGRDPDGWHARWTALTPVYQDIARELG